MSLLLSVLLDIPDAEGNPGTILKSRCSEERFRKGSQHIPAGLDDQGKTALRALGNFTIQAPGQGYRQKEDFIYSYYGKITCRICIFLCQGNR